MSQVHRLGWTLVAGGAVLLAMAIAVAMGAPDEPVSAPDGIRTVGRTLALAGISLTAGGGMVLGLRMLARAGLAQRDGGPYD